MSHRPLLIAAAAACLAACASTPTAPKVAFAPRVDASLATDSAACDRVADEININSPKEYTDGRYGVAAAMAARLDHQSVKGGTVDRMRDAVFQDCMVRKGWTPK